MTTLTPQTYELCSLSELNCELNKRGYRLRENGEVERGNGTLAHVLEVLDLEDLLEEQFGQY